jgi:hypothetical protein
MEVKGKSKLHYQLTRYYKVIRGDFQVALVPLEQPVSSYLYQPHFSEEDKHTPMMPVEVVHIGGNSTGAFNKKWTHKLPC